MVVLGQAHPEKSVHWVFQGCGKLAGCQIFLVYGYQSSICCLGRRGKDGIGTFDSGCLLDDINKILHSGNRGASAIEPDKVV